jgi:FkbM family methyltransferase
MLKSFLHALVWMRRHRAGVLPAPEFAPLARCLAADDVFIDVGVHAGSWSVPASRVLTSGRVYAFEALPYYAGVLKIMLRLMGRGNVTVIVGAVSDREGEVEIVWKDASGRRLTGMTHINRGGEAGGMVRVPALTIDAFRRTHPAGRIRLIKCDVEGAELMVLRGAAATIEASRPLVFLELYEAYCSQYGYAAADVFAFFQARQYRSMQFQDGGFAPLYAGDYGGSGDVLFVPAEIEIGAACA